MHIHHVAIWAQDLEALKAFYCTLFGGQANERYHNPTKQFSSYFVRFEGDASLELMHNPRDWRRSRNEGHCLASSSILGSVPG